MLTAIIVISIVLFIILKPLNALLLILTLASPFLIFLTIYEIGKTAREGIKARKYHTRNTNINIGSINMFIRHYTDNNSDSHDQYSYRK